LISIEIESNCDCVATERFMPARKNPHSRHLVGEQEGNQRHVGFGE
jgi:hypothetical protein